MLKVPLPLLVAGCLCGTLTAQSLHLPDSSSYVDFGAAPAVTDGGDDFTFECWWKGLGWPILMSRRHGESPSVNFPALGVTNYGVDGYNHWPPGNYQGANDGNWHHIAHVKSGSTYRVYLDGNLAGSIVDTNPCTSSMDLRIGRQQAWFNHGWSGGWTIGQLDEVRYWDHVRTQADIQADMHRKISQATGLVASWHFDVDATDAAGSTHGTMIGNATIAPDGAPVEALSLSVPALTAGSSATFTIDDAMPFGRVHLAATGQGPGSATVPGTSIVLDLSPPLHLVGSATADLQGTALISRVAPAAMAGRSFHFQAFQVNGGATLLSSVVAATIQ